MSASTQYTCDQCGAVKGAANHWFAAREYGKHAGQVPFLAIKAFENADFGDSHICGERCVHIMASAFLSRITGAVTGK